MFTLLPTLNDSSVGKVQGSPQGAFPGRDEISTGGLEEVLILARRRRDKEAASRGGMQSESIKYVSAEGNRERAAEHAQERRQADHDVILMCILIATASSSTSV